MIAALLFGCTVEGNEGSAAVGGDTAPSDLPGGRDTGEVQEETGDSAEPEPDDFGCSDLFDQETLAVYDMTIDEGDWHRLETEWRTSDGTKDYFPITLLTVNDEVIPDAQIRLKGNNGCCWVGDKMQFVVAFNEVDEDARVHGLRKIALDSPYYEPTVLKNRLANWYLLRAGLPGACTNSALLYVNGDFFGLYAHMEELDHEFLERNFGKDDADGDLWKYGTVLDNHEDEVVDYSRISDFWATYDPAITTTMGNPDQWITEWAAEAILPDGDGYWCCGHNYYLYDHPDRGFLWVPWDKDGTFDWVADPTMDPTALWYPSVTPHMAYLLADPEWEARYEARIADLVPLYGGEEMVAALAQMVEQTEPWGSIDPYRYYDDASYAYYLANLQSYVVARRAYLDAWVATHSP